MTNALLYDYFNYYLFERRSSLLTFIRVTTINYELEYKYNETDRVFFLKSRSKLFTISKSCQLFQKNRLSAKFRFVTNFLNRDCYEVRY